MKKINWLVWLLGLFFLVGCGEEPVVNISTDEAEHIALRLVDACIYQKLVTEFAPNLSEEQAAILLRDKEELTENITTGLQETAGISQKEAAVVAETLTDEMKKKTRFQVASVQQDENYFLVTYEISGLNYFKAMETAYGKLYQEAVKDTTLAADQQRMDQLVMKAYGEAIPEAGVLELPLQCSIELHFDDENWFVTDAEVVLEQLRNSFLYGYLDQTVMNDDTHQLSDQIVMEDGKELPGRLRFSNDLLSSDQMAIRLQYAIYLPDEQTDQLLTLLYYDFLNKSQEPLVPAEIFQQYLQVQQLEDGVMQPLKQAQLPEADPDYPLQHFALEKVAAGERAQGVMVYRIPNPQEEFEVSFCNDAQQVLGVHGYLSYE